MNPLAVNAEGSDARVLSEPPGEHSESFDHPEFIFEPKNDDLRALAYIDEGNCGFVSRAVHPF